MTRYERYYEILLMAMDNLFALMEMHKGTRSSMMGFLNSQLTYIDRNINKIHPEKLRPITEDDKEWLCTEDADITQDEDDLDMDLDEDEVTDLDDEDSEDSTQLGVISRS